MQPLELRYNGRPTKYRRRPYHAPTRRSSVNRRNVYHHGKPAYLLQLRSKIDRFGFLGAPPA